MRYSHDPERNRQFIRNTVIAAKQANIKLLVFNTSGFVPDDVTGVTAFDIKRELVAYVKESGIPSIILQPIFYMENFLIPGVVDKLPIIGPEALTGNQLAEQFSAALDREIQFYSLPAKAFEEALSTVMDKVTATALADSYRWAETNTHLLPKPEQVIDEMRSAIPGTPLIKWIKQGIQHGFFTLMDEVNKK